MEKIVADYKKKLENLEEKGYSPLSKKYISASNKYFEQKTLLEELKRQ